MKKEELLPYLLNNNKLLGEQVFQLSEKILSQLNNFNLSKFIQLGDVPSIVRKNFLDGYNKGYISYIKKANMLNNQARFFSQEIVSQTDIQKMIGEVLLGIFRFPEGNGNNQKPQILEVTEDTSMGVGVIPNNVFKYYLQAKSYWYQYLTEFYTDTAMKKTKSMFVEDDFEYKSIDVNQLDANTFKNMRAIDKVLLTENPDLFYYKLSQKEIFTKEYQKIEFVKKSNKRNKLYVGLDISASMQGYEFGKPLLKAKAMALNILDYCVENDIDFNLILFHELVSPVFNMSLGVETLKNIILNAKVSTGTNFDDVLKRIIDDISQYPEVDNQILTVLITDGRQHLNILSKNIHLHTLYMTNNLEKTNLDKVGSFELSKNIFFE